MKTKLLFLSLLISSTCLAKEGVPFPGKTISPTVVRELTTGNNTLTAIFERTGNSLRLASLQSPLNGLDLAWNDPNLFTIHLAGNAQSLASSAMKMAVTGPLAATFTDDTSGLRAHWTAAIKDGANYLTQSIRLEATRGAVTVDRIEMIRASVPGAKVTGYTDGSPITNDKLFLGIEHPMAQNTVTGANVAASSTVVCSLPRQCTLEPGTTWTVTSGIGVYPAGQLRRAFLYYLERERAHPYRQYWHYNSWYDLNIGCNHNPDPLKRMNEQQCLDVIRAFGAELHDKRGFSLNGFVWDDGWDDWNSLWDFHTGFPNGFAKLKEEAAKQGAGMGAWLSPWGGYGGSQTKRVAFGKSKGYETNPGGFSLGGPKYYAAYRDTCVRFIRDYSMNYFKFDGIGGGMYASGAPASISPDLDNLVRLLRELRQANPEVFINCTVGTWASPYWTWFADSVWRQGEDCAYTGEGNARERWITYRDERIYTRFANPSPLYPLNSMMYHGLLVGSRHRPAAMPKPAQNIESYRHEVMMSVGCGSGLGELYVTPSLMTAEAWDILAEGLKWSRAHSEILCDTHWVGGHPVKEVYGYASWHPAKGGTVVLRNPTGKEQTFVLNPQQIFELPAGAPQRYKFTPELNAQIEPLSASADKPAMLTLHPFQVVLMEAQPTQSGPP